MFVVHLLQDDKPTSTRDYGHVNQFFRNGWGLFRRAKDEEIFKECVAQGFIYIHVHGRYNVYQKQLDLLLDEVAYNRTTYGY